MLPKKFFPLPIAWLLGLLLLVANPPASFAQEKSASPAAPQNSTFPALLISDIHFDPLHDPGKVPQLVKAKVSRWNAILSAPSSPNQAQAFAELQQNCGQRGADTSYSLLQSALQAMRARQADAKFLAVSGDLMAHTFDCRYAKLFPESKPGEYQAFVLKTLSYVVRELRTAFPGVPVYVALGNNDSACRDYQLNPGSEFLAQTGKIVAEALPEAQRQEARAEFAKGGYYALTMAAPMPGTRLIVVNDVFLSPYYRDCQGKSSADAANAQMAWLQEQLAEAQRLHQPVWVMGHIPPGIDPYTTIPGIEEVCASGTPKMFLSSGQLADTLIAHADVIRLGLFAHSHMDEVRLLGPDAGAPHGASEHSVAVKMVPSISPIDGNDLAFTVAQVNAATAVLENYEVIAASNQSGVATTWSKEYDFDQTYHAAQFSPATLENLIAGFARDRGAKSESSQAYIRNYYVGGRSREVSTSWPIYVCALAHHTPKGFAGCACSGGR
jgi:sphingomyelin phosphodiesterase acid-like 3